MTAEPHDSLTPQRINEIRQMQGPAVALTLYLDLPEDQAREICESPTRENVLALGRDLSQDLVRLLQARRDAVVDLDDEAARAITLFQELGPDRQAVLASLVEAAFWSRPATGKPDVFATENIEATWRWNIGRFGFEEAQRIRRDAEAASGAAETQEAPLDANDVVEAVSNIVRFPRAE